MDTTEERKREAQRWFERAYEAQMSGELNTAIAYYKRSIAILPTAEAHTFLGWTYSFQGRTEEAIEECLRAIAVDPTFGNPYNDIGAYLIELGRWEDAIPWLEKAIVAPRYEARAYPHCNLGRVYEHLGQWQKAIDCYRQALAISPDYTLARVSLWNLLVRLN